MTGLTAVMASVVLLFGFFVFLRSVWPIKICAFCAAVAMTWLGLLWWWLTRGIGDPLLLGILMGGSVVGLMYFLADKLPEKYLVFRPAFFLTGLTVAYWLLAGTVTERAWLVLVIIWLFSFVLLRSRNSRGLGPAVRKIINCCKDW